MSEKIEVNETRTAYVVRVNTDRTEGRGHLVPIAYCWSETTARRAAKGQDVQGADGRVEPFPAIEIEGFWYGPVCIAHPSQEDQDADKRNQARRAAIERAKAAGLTDEEIELLGAKL